MATVQKFEDLLVWQLARELSQKIYPLTFLDPIAKDFRYKDQIRGACGSIMDNIAEGFERGSKREFIHSLTIAKEKWENSNRNFTGERTTSTFHQSCLMNYMNLLTA